MPLKIKKLADQLASRYGSRDPFQLADSLGYTVIFAHLEGLRGMFKDIHRCPTIFINSALDERQQSLVCAHEIGHSQLHRGFNRIFLDRYTQVVSAKYENEAHKFAVALLYPDDELREMAEWPIEQIANRLGVPPWLAEYRIKIALQEEPR